MNDALHQANVYVSSPWVAPSEAGLMAGERIVVVDDHAELVETLAQVLALDGFAVRTAPDGASALAVIEEHNPICVLVDIDMPGMNGFDLVKHLRERHGSDMVLIAITGWGGGDARLAAEFEAFDHVLCKPVDLQELREMLSAS
jgi:DNA-binding response OmpR family regulator